VVFAWVLNVFESAQGHVGVDKVWIALYEPGPLVVPRHSDGASAKLFDRRVHLVCVALQDGCEGVVGLLYLANDNGLELAPRVLEVEISLVVLATYLMSCVCWCTL
jgi:hypothetical protein